MNARTHWISPFCWLDSSIIELCFHHYSSTVWNAKCDKKNTLGCQLHLSDFPNELVISRMSWRIPKRVAFSWTFPGSFSLTFPGSFSLTFPGSCAGTFPGSFLWTFPGSFAGTWNEHSSHDPPWCQIPTFTGPRCLNVFNFADKWVEQRYMDLKGATSCSWVQGEESRLLLRLTNIIHVR